MIRFTIIFLVIFQSITFAGVRQRPVKWATKMIGSDLKNFYHLDDKVYRSEQPDKESMERLEKFRIKEILNLRQYHSDDDEAKGTKLILHHIKVNTSKVSYQQIFRALEFIKNSKGPILIHCWHGSDRTGVISASYRIVFQNWSKKMAIDEMRNGGYGYHESFYPGLIKVIEKLDIKKFREKLDLKE